MNIEGLVAGYSGPGGKTVLPHRALAKLDLRLVPDMTFDGAVSWVLRIQGNLSLVALALSVLLIWQDMAWALPGLWLLLLGHSFYLLGGIAFEPFRVCGLVYQVGGVAALWPGAKPLAVFAVATALGNLWVGVSVWRSRRGE